MQQSGAMPYEVLKERVTGELKKLFRPELLNRVDEVIVFHDLALEEIEAIVDLMISRLRDQLATKGIGIVVTPEARTLLARAGYDPALGARPLRRAIQRLVEDPLSEQILAGEWETGTTVDLITEGETVTFRPGMTPAEGVAAPAKRTRSKASMPSRSGSRSRRGPVAGGAAGE